MGCRLQIQGVRKEQIFCEGDNKMKTKKMIFSIILSVLALIVAQILSQLIASIVILVKMPLFVANILVGFLYVGFAYLFAK